MAVNTLVPQISKYSLGISTLICFSARKIPALKTGLIRSVTFVFLQQFVSFNVPLSSMSVKRGAADSLTGAVLRGVLNHVSYLARSAITNLLAIRPLAPAAPPPPMMDGASQNAFIRPRNALINDTMFMEADEYQHCINCSAAPVTPARKEAGMRMNGRAQDSFEIPRVPAHLFYAICSVVSLHLSAKTE